MSCSAGFDDRFKAPKFVPVTDISADSSFEACSFSVGDLTSTDFVCAVLRERAESACSPTVLESSYPRKLSNKEASIYKFLPVLIKLYIDVSISAAFYRLYVIFCFSGSVIL